MISIDIETSDIELRNKKSGGTYHVQTAYVHTVDRNGKPQRYPERCNIFPPRDNNGTPMPYQPGTYTLAPQTIRVVNGFLELGFPQLIPVKSK